MGKIRTAKNNANGQDRYKAPVVNQVRSMNNLAGCKIMSQSHYDYLKRTCPIKANSQPSTLAHFCHDGIWAYGYQILWFFKKSLEYGFLGSISLS